MCEYDTRVSNISDGWKGTQSAHTPGSADFMFGNKSTTNRYKSAQNALKGLKLRIKRVPTVFGGFGGPRAAANIKELRTIKNIRIEIGSPNMPWARGPANLSDVYIKSVHLVHML